MKLLNFGSCNIDFVYSLDHFVCAGETEATYKMEQFPGGKGLNQSIAIANAGAHVFHAGCVGTDGGFLVELLRERKVDVSFLKELSGEKNGHAVIQVNKDGENAIFLHPGSNQKITREQIDDVLSGFGEGDILLLQNEISQLGYIVERAHQKRMCIILNPSPIDKAIHELDFNKLSYLILNEVEVCDLSGFDEVEDSLQYFAQKYPGLKIMLTLGKNGCVYQDAEQKIFVPCFEAEVVDTTAAGDTFTGYFVAGLYEGKDLTETLKTASCAAAIAVSRHGAAPSIPLREEVLDALSKMRLKMPSLADEKIRSELDKYLRRNMRDGSLKGFSERIGYSATHTGNCVKQLTGKTFKQYQQEKRMLFASELLLKSDLPIGEIIRRAGYENESHFRSLFRKTYGENPLNYRKNGGKVNDK